VGRERVVLTGGWRNNNSSTTRRDPRLLARSRSAARRTLGATRAGGPTGPQPRTKWELLACIPQRIEGGPRRLTTTCRLRGGRLLNVRVARSSCAITKLFRRLSPTEGRSRGRHRTTPTSSVETISSGVGSGARGNSFELECGYGFVTLHEGLHLECLRVHLVESVFRFWRVHRVCYKMI
jgi:hypothetical protein